MLTKVRVMSAAMMLVSGAAFAAPPGGLTTTDWRDSWRADRNRIIETTPDLEFDPTSILVKFADGAANDDRDLALAMVGGRVIRTWDNLIPGVAHIEVNVPVDEAIAQLEPLVNAGLLEYVEPDHIVHADATPNDPLYSTLWGMNSANNADIDAPQAWDKFKGFASFRIAVIDTGIRKTHEDLAANMWTNTAEPMDGVDNDGNGYVDDTWGWNCYANNNNPADGNGHGTHCAGTIGAVGNNAKGVVGVNWSCKLVALKFLSDGGSGSTSDAIEAINYAANSYIRVSNNSWGGTGYNASLLNAITAARTKGHILVCAAGNAGTNNDTSPFYPANYNSDNVISVGAINSSNAKASFSNYGQTQVDLFAPGENIRSTYRSSDASYTYLSGTSMAAPHVTGVVALVWGKTLSWNWITVKNRIMTTTKPVASLATRCVTGGVVNANNALP